MVTDDGAGADGSVTVRARSRFPLLGEPLPLDLVNTWYVQSGQVVDLLPDPEALGEWVAGQGDQIPVSLRRPDRSSWAAVVRLRGPVKSCIQARRAGRPLSEQAVGALNRTAAAAPVHDELRQTPDGSIGRVSRRTGTSAQQLAAILAEATIALLCDGRSLAIRECDGDDCELLFLSAGARRRWCSPAICGNRARVARHYWRHRSPSRTPTS
jgi:predicted RNA-binding Zn ribbon-like protein